MNNFSNYHVKLISQPVKNSFIISSVKGNEDGRDVLYFSVVGNPSTFTVFDVNEKKVLRSFAHGSDENDSDLLACWTHVSDSKGDIYMAPFGYPSLLLKYSKKDKTLKSLGSPLGEHAIFHLSVDERDHVYGGTYPSGKTFEYDPFCNQFVDLGVMHEKEVYSISNLYYKGEIFSGSRSEKAKLVRFHKKTKEKKVIENNLFSSGVIGYYSMTIFNDINFIFVKTGDGKYFLIAYDIIREKWLDLCERSLGGHQYLSEPLENKAYFAAFDGTIKGIDLETATAFDTGIPYIKYEEDDDGIDYPNGITGGGFYRLKDQKNYPGWTYICSNYDHNGLAYINLDRKKTEFVTTDDLPKNPVLIHALSKGLGDDIFIGAFMGDTVCKYRIKDKSFEPMHVRQTEGITSCNSKMYFGVYPRACIWEYDYDCENEREKNPKPLFVVGQKQDRPFALCGFDETLAIGTIPDYGKLGGALALYHTVTRQVEVYRNIIKNQSITGLCYRNGLIYGTTGIWGGLGSHPAAERAKVFIFDPVLKKVVLEREIELEGYSVPVMHLGQIKFDPEGVLYCMTSGILLELNPKTLEVERYADLDGLTQDKEETIWKPYYLEFSKNNEIFCNPNHKLAVVQKDTLQYQLLGVSAENLVLGNDDVLYFSDKYNFYQLMSDE